MPGHCVKVPQQNNFTDCGLYLLQYVEYFFLDPIRDYRTPIKLHDWFDTLIVTKKREDISNLLKELIQKHNPDGLPLPDIKFPTLNGKVFFFLLIRFFFVNVFSHQSTGKLIIDPDENFNDAEFEEEEMEDEEFVTGSQESSTSERLIEEEPSRVIPIQTKKTIKLKRLNSAGTVTGALANNSTATGNSGQSLLASSQKRPLEGVKSGADCSIRPKAAKLSDSPNKVVTTQN